MTKLIPTQASDLRDLLSSLLVLRIKNATVIWNVCDEFVAASSEVPRD